MKILKGQVVCGVTGYITDYTACFCEWGYFEAVEKVQVMVEITSEALATGGVYEFTLQTEKNTVELPASLAHIQGVTATIFEIVRRWLASELCM